MSTTVADMNEFEQQMDALSRAALSPAPPRRCSSCGGLITLDWETTCGELECVANDLGIDLGVQD